MSAPAVILASASPARRAVLEGAGVAFEVKPANVDEETLIASMQAENAPPGHIAEALAELKAIRISTGDALTIGCDQVLVCEGRLFQKPADAEAAKETLRALRGKAHKLISAMVVAKTGAAIWRHTDEAVLTMRAFSDDFLEAYVARGVPEILSSVGAYRLEGEGAQLFSSVDGDFFSILGLPLLPLLDLLRRHGAVPE